MFRDDDELGDYQPDCRIDDRIYPNATLDMIHYLRNQKPSATGLEICLTYDGIVDKIEKEPSTLVEEIRALPELEDKRRYFLRTVRNTWLTKKRGELPMVELVPRDHADSRILVFDEDVEDDEGDDAKDDDSQTDDESLFEKCRRRLAQLARHLGERDGMLLKLWLDGKSIEEMEQYFGVHRTTIWRWRIRLIERLKTLLGLEGDNKKGDEDDEHENA